MAGKSNFVWRKKDRTKGRLQITIIFKLDLFQITMSWDALGICCGVRMYFLQGNRREINVHVRNDFCINNQLPNNTIISIYSIYFFILVIWKLSISD